MISTPVDSIALFGSFVRSDYDIQSDRDILLVSNHDIDDAVCRLSHIGYSPSVYNWQQITDLAADGSLFLQHLKQESQVVMDKNGLLSKILHAYRPVGAYQRQCHENNPLFCITKGTPADPLTQQWAFDVLAVAIRNFAILHLAQREKYVFGFYELMNELAHEFDLSADETELLIDLRDKKFGYRRQILDKDWNALCLHRTQAIIEKIVQIECTMTPMSTEQFLESTFSVDLSTLPWYHALRRCEGAYRAMGYMPGNSRSSVHSKLEAIFSKPSSYSTAHGGIAWVSSQVKSLKAIRI